MIARALVLLAFAASVAAQQTAPMNEDRFGQAAVLLPDGRVAVIGGYEMRLAPAAPVERKTAEIYDPATRTFSLLGPMTLQHAEVFAFLLGSGEVAIASRWGRSLELFDPRASTFRVVPGDVGQVYHAARITPSTLFLYSESCRVCEPRNVFLYERAPERIRSFLGVEQNRAYGTATTLPDGRVLIAGGSRYRFVEGGGYDVEHVSSAYLFDPVTGVLQPTGELTTRRAFHSATLLKNGRVLVAGGVGGRSCVFGSGICGMLDTTEIYEPLTGTFAPGPRLGTATFQHTATMLPNGKVLIAGGDTGNGNPTARTEIYDPTANRFTAGTRLHAKRSYHTATLLHDGNVLIAGGFMRVGSSLSGLASAEIYAAGAPCAFALSSSAIPFVATGGRATVAVTTSAGCTWSATTSDSWIAVAPDRSTDDASGAFTFSVAANATGAAREGTIRVAGQTIVVSQTAPARSRAVRH